MHPDLLHPEPHAFPGRLFLFLPSLAKPTPRAPRSGFGGGSSMTERNMKRSRSASAAAARRGGMDAGAGAAAEDPHSTPSGGPFGDLDGSFLDEPGLDASGLHAPDLHAPSECLSPPPSRAPRFSLDAFGPSCLGILMPSPSGYPMRRLGSAFRASPISMPPP